MTELSRNPSFASLLQRFFVDHLQRHRTVSPQTIAAYRDTFRLLLIFAENYLQKQPQNFTLEDLNSKLVLAFLDHLEVERRNSSMQHTTISPCSMSLNRHWRYR
jgi:integrase/recombinase XerD